MIKKKKLVTITIHPDNRYDPVCSHCQHKVKSIHSYHERTARDLNCLKAEITLTIRYRTVKRPRCGNRFVELDFVHPGKRVTKILAQYILFLCSAITIKDVAQYLRLNWKTVKAVPKKYLKNKFTQGIASNPRLLAVDEVVEKKRHHYLTFVLNWKTREVIFVGRERKGATLKPFFNSLSEEQKDSIEAIVMDTWVPCIKALRECCPKAVMVFDQFHLVKAFGKVINRVQRKEFKKAT